jgi:hypothetical protein
MSQNDGLTRLKIVLAVFFVSYLFYGVSFLFFPGMLSEMSGDPVHLGWIRWSGGALFALGIGAVQAFRNPARHGSFVTVATISALLIGCSLLYSKLMEPSTKHAWFTLTPCFINLGLFVLLLWARQGAREALK